MDTDGLCGNVMPQTLADGTWLRCIHDFGHDGECSWKAYQRRRFGGGDITPDDVARRAALGSVSAQVIAQGIMRGLKDD